MSESLQALRRANPRAQEHFDESIAMAADAIRERISGEPPRPRAIGSGPGRRIARMSIAVATVAIVAAGAFSMLGSYRSGSGIDDAQAAVRKAATVSAASAERSGTAVVRITHNGELWAGTTIRWHGDDLALSNDAPGRDGRAGSGLLVVGGMMYGVDPLDGRWVELGSPASVDPGSGTTPAEYLASVREDVGGVTLARIARGMSGAHERRLADGSHVYAGSVAAGLIARETGFKEGQRIRVLPFGYVAHDEAADAASPLDVAVTVDPGGIVRELAVSWGTGTSAWTYTVAYSNLGTTRALNAPKNARPFPDRTP